MNKEPKEIKGTVKISPLLAWVDDYEKLERVDKSAFRKKFLVQKFGANKRLYKSSIINIWTRRRSIPPLEVAKWATSELQTMIQDIKVLAGATVNSEAN